MDPEVVSGGTARASHASAVRAESITIDEGYVGQDGLDEATLDDRLRPGPLGPALAQHVIELVLERSDARRNERPLAVRTPAVAVTLTARAVDLGAGPLALEALFEVAHRAVAAFIDHGFLAVIRPGDGPTFLYPLPDLSADDDGEPLDEVVMLCRQLDEEQARARAVAIAESFRAGLERAPVLRDLLVEVRLGEGAILGAPARVGVLLPASTWRPV